MYPRLFQFGNIAIPTYGALTALGLVAGLAAAMYFARRFALDADKVWNLSLIGILSTLLGARLVIVLTYFSAFRQHPFWILGLTNLRDPWIIPAGVLLGFAAALLYALAEGLPVLRTMDCLAPPAALALVIERIGAFIAGADFGSPATLPWSVTYTSRLAELWYRTPPGIALQPVQLYEAAASLAIFLLLLVWLPRRKQDGEIAGAWLFLYGIASFFLGLYRGETGQSSLSQSIAFAAVIAGAALWLSRRGNAAEYTSTDALPKEKTFHA